MGNLSKAQKKIENFKLDIIQDLDKARGIIKFEANASKNKILALESELNKDEWYIKGLEESRLRLIEQIREERRIFEQEMEKNFGYAVNSEVEKEQ